MIPPDRWKREHPPPRTLRPLSRCGACGGALVETKEHLPTLCCAGTAAYLSHSFIPSLLLGPVIRSDAEATAYITITRSLGDTVTCLTGRTYIYRREASSPSSILFGRRISTAWPRTAKRPGHPAHLHEAPSAQSSPRRQRARQTSVAIRSRASSSPRYVCRGRRPVQSA